MLDDWDERDEVVAAGSICPVPDCGALVISYRPPDRTGRDNAKSWCEFTCPRCGIDFTVPEEELIFQSVPKVWLLARVQAAWSGGEHRGTANHRGKRGLGSLPLGREV
jgi:hypothetical protein